MAAGELGGMLTSLFAAFDRERWEIEAALACARGPAIGLLADSIRSPNCATSCRGLYPELGADARAAA